MVPRRESRQVLRVAEEVCKLRARRKSGNVIAKEFVPGPQAD